jgi:hypothetical protein
MRTARNFERTQPPDVVPLYGGSIAAPVTAPLGANVTHTRAAPLGPSVVLHDCTSAAAADSTLAATSRLKVEGPGRGSGNGHLSAGK